MYARLNDGIIQYAPNYIKTSEGKYILNPQESNYNEHDYFLVEYSEKPILESEETYKEHYIKQDNKIIITYEVISPSPEI